VDYREGESRGEKLRGILRLERLGGWVGGRQEKRGGAIFERVSKYRMVGATPRRSRRTSSSSSSSSVSVLDSKAKSSKKGGKESLALTPAHEHDTRRKERMKKVANSLTAMHAVTKFKRSTGMKVGSPDAASDPEEHDDVYSEVNELGDDVNDEEVGMEQNTSMMKIQSTGSKTESVEGKYVRNGLMAAAGLLLLILYVVLPGSSGKIENSFIANQSSWSNEEAIEAIVAQKVKTVLEESLEPLDGIKNELRALESQLAEVRVDANQLVELFEMDRVNGLRPEDRLLLPKIQEMINDLTDLVDEGATASSSSEEMETIRKLEKAMRDLEAFARKESQESCKQMEDKLETLKWKVEEKNSDASVSAEGNVADPRATRAMIHSEMEKYAADRIGIPDFALASVGGSIVKKHGLTSPSYDPEKLSFHPLSVFRTGTRAPETVLDSDVTIGRCWPCEVYACNITIELSKALNIQQVSIDHISKSIAHDIGSAPKDFSVFGIRRLPGSRDEEADYINLGSFSYDINNPNLVQTFNVESADYTNNLVRFVKFQFTSNHGRSDFTCIYRIRVHGNQNNI